MNEILLQFPLAGAPVACTRIGQGHIHQTFLVTTDAGAQYILQRLNRHVFPDLDAVMGNAEKLAAFLAGEDGAAPLIRYLPGRKGGLLAEDGAGFAWRAYPFVPDSVSLQTPETLEDCRQAALAFGRFQQALRRFPAERLKETIADFHNTPDRFQRLREIAARDRLGRGAEVQKELAFVFAREERACALYRLWEQGSLPLRVTHNDAKLNNVLLDRDTRKAICVIDLDTVMPGLAAYDFGDLVRSCGAAAPEDERDAGRIVLDLERYQALRQGFCEGCPDLTEAELASLPLGAYAMTLECGVRFLTDYLDGDRYFAVVRERHNLDRARNQLLLVRDMERKWDRICAG